MRKRKYPTKHKTTTPEGLREYRKLQQRDIRAQKRKERELRLSKFEAELRAINEGFLNKIIAWQEHQPDYQKLSSENKQKLKDGLRRVMDSGVTEVIQYQREFETQLPAVLQKITHDTILKIEQERKAYVNQKFGEFIDTLSDDEKFALWKIVASGRLEKELKKIKKTEEAKVKQYEH